LVSKDWTAGGPLPVPVLASLLEPPLLVPPLSLPEPLLLPVPLLLPLEDPLSCCPPLDESLELALASEPLELAPVSDSPGTPPAVSLVPHAQRTEVRAPAAIQGTVPILDGMREKSAASPIRLRQS
jgi:hypothetical protein